MKRGTLNFAAGLLTGALLFGGTAVCAAGLLAERSTNPIYVDGRQVQMEAYAINGSNYVKLRDIGQAVGFNVYWDSRKGSVQVDSAAPYTGEGPVAGAITVPSDGSRYIPQTGDIIRCDDGTNYTITDVSRYDKNAFASGPLPPLPEPTCDWSQFDQPELSPAEVRRFNDPDGDYLFVRNLYEIRRVLYTFYNAMGENERTWQNGAATLRADGTPWVHFILNIPAEKLEMGFWPWREEDVVAQLHARPSGDYYIEVWDVYSNGIYQRTEYNII